MIKKIFLVFIFLIGLLYLYWPASVNVSQLPALPNSLKSDEPDDTYVYPNTAAYFSYSRRGEVIPIYKDAYQKLYCLDNFFKAVNIFCYVQPVRNNRFVEDADKIIKDQMLVTYLEEYSYPLKSTLFINGYEPYDEQGHRFNKRSYPILINDTLFDTKTTLKIYEPYRLAQLVVYVGMWITVIWGYILIKKVWKTS